jgi:antitoxin VapB
VGISIKDPETDRLIRELARRTGETEVDAVKTAVTELLARLVGDDDRPRLGRRVRLVAIAQDTAARLAGVVDSTDIGSLLYGERGLPT